MTTSEELLRENFETVYEVHHQAKGGFHGNTSIWIAVIDETDDKIVGRRFGPMRDWPGDKVVVMKNNVAGWQEKRFRYRKIPNELPTPSVDELREAYAEGRIDDNELEEGLEEAMSDA